MDKVTQGTFMGAGSGALSGAAVGGTVGGPWGAALGAVGGGLIGGLSGYFSGKGQGAKEDAINESRRRMQEMIRQNYALRMQNLEKAAGYFNAYKNKWGSGAMPDLTFKDQVAPWDQPVTGNWK